MQRDLIFFVNGIPEKMQVWDEHFFFAPVEKDILDQIQKLGDDFTQMASEVRREISRLRFAK